MFVLTARKNINVSCGLTTLELSLKLAQQNEFRNENRETVFWHCVQTRYLSEPDWTYWHLTLKLKKTARSQCSLQVGTSTNVCTDGSNNTNVSITIIFHSSSVSQSESVATKSGGKLEIYLLLKSEFHFLPPNFTFVMVFTLFSNFSTFLPDLTKLVLQITLFKFFPCFYVDCVCHVCGLVNLWFSSRLCAPH